MDYKFIHFGQDWTFFGDKEIWPNVAASWTTYQKSVTLSGNDQIEVESEDGDGSGTVTSDPGGIDCGETCVGWFAEGATVQLTAMPAAKSLFAGWSGDADCEDGVVTLTAEGGHAEKLAPGCKVSAHSS